MLATSTSDLCTAYDLAMLDLDGVVYIGSEAVPGAAASLARATSRGMRLAFVTNNAARPPDAVAEHLVSLGVEAGPEDVVTSAQAAARVLLDELGPGGRVALLGGRGLDEALRAASLVPVGIEDAADAVVTGYGPDVVWAEVMRAAVRIRDGLRWVASNTDMSIPTPYGRAPGHGVLVDTLRRFSDVEPTVAGKPERPLLEETIRRMGAARPLMVGDRLDTDIEGGRRVGADTLLVLTGVTGLAELVAARPEERPSYLAPTLAGLLESHAAPERDGDAWACDGWVARRTGPDLAVSGSGSAPSWWRAVAVAAWEALDETGEVVGTGGLTPPHE